MSDNTMLEAALMYAAQGLAVSPFYPKSKTPSSGKGGFNNATTDETIIKKWWGDSPDHNIAITAGKPSKNLVVLDLLLC